jgi:hypothetical protein
MPTVVYWMTRVIIVIPLSRLMDKIKGEVDEYTFMIVGTFLISIIPLFIRYRPEPWHIYVLQIVNGIANSMRFPRGEFFLLIMSIRNK